MVCFPFSRGLGPGPFRPFPFQAFLAPGAVGGGEEQTNAAWGKLTEVAKEDLKTPYNRHSAAAAMQKAWNQIRSGGGDEPSRSEVAEVRDRLAAAGSGVRGE